MAACGFAAMLAAEARAVHHVQLELLPHGEAELHVFTAYLVVAVEAKGLEMLSANQHRGTGDRWYRS